ncbi:LPXTG cell wall anchor domain-containing protein [Coprobacillus sp. AF17-11AC]|nr:LPXTG cell wall anchor domain-containing protein [Coprobacillus sp. AF17-17AC]RGG83019.1 LPXTG cell wall anchor domain-containing protein [Coprobacillus sp. AF17-11AC]
MYKLNDTNKSDADKNKDSKKTGDTTNVVPYVVVGIVALVEVVFFVVKKKKND